MTDGNAIAQNAPTTADVVRKTAAEVGGALLGETDLPDWKRRDEQIQKRREAETEHQWKLSVFAEILRARHELSPEAAADETLKVFAKLR